MGLARATARRQPLRQYSKGMLQRAGMAHALVSDPALVLLDEPMSGLDPLGRAQIREIVQALQQQGKTICLNTNALSEVEQLCDHVAILAQGELLCVGTLSDLYQFSWLVH